MSLSSNHIYKVTNVINNNIVIVKDFNGREMIAIGKGLGFRKKKKDYVYPDEIMKTYIYIDKHKSNMFSLFEEVPFEVIEVSQKIIDHATNTLNQKFNVNLLVSLADHINFSLFEYKKGNTMPKLVNEEVKRFYKDEYQVGLYAVKLINDTFSINLEKDEATSDFGPRAVCDACHYAGGVVSVLLRGRGIVRPLGGDGPRHVAAGPHGPSGVLVVCPAGHHADSHLRSFRLEAGRQLSSVAPKGAEIIVGHRAAECSTARFLVGRQ